MPVRLVLTGMDVGAVRPASRLCDAHVLLTDVWCCLVAQALGDIMRLLGREEVLARLALGSSVVLAGNKQAA